MKQCGVEKWGTRQVCFYKDFWSPCCLIITPLREVWQFPFSIKWMRQLMWRRCAFHTAKQRADSFPYISPYKDSWVHGMTGWLCLISEDLPGLFQLFIRLLQKHPENCQFSSRDSGSTRIVYILPGFNFYKYRFHFAIEFFISTVVQGIQDYISYKTHWIWYKQPFN
jgi:hypothetical protein